MSLTFSTPAANLSAAQFRRRLVLALFVSGGVFFSVFACAVWLHTSPLFYAQIEHAGIFLIFVAIAGRTWSALHIGGHKKVALIDTGPYSIVRNPLYVFSVIGAAGIGAQTSSLVVTTACAIGTALILASITLKEDDFLSAKFGAAYDDYARRVPRFLPKFSVYRDVDSLTIKPRVVYRTFLESSLFLLAIPAIDAIEVAREFGWLPELMHLP